MLNMQKAPPTDETTGFRYHRIFSINIFEDIMKESLAEVYARWVCVPVWKVEIRWKVVQSIVDCFSEAVECRHTRTNLW